MPDVDIRNRQSNAEDDPVVMALKRISASLDRLHDLAGKAMDSRFNRSVIGRDMQAEVMETKKAFIVYRDEISSWLSDQSVQDLKHIEELGRTQVILADALRDAAQHLDYCGYGDKYEREGAYEAGLPQKIEAALKLVED